MDTTNNPMDSSVKTTLKEESYNSSANNPDENAKLSEIYEEESLSSMFLELLVFNFQPPQMEVTNENKKANTNRSTMMLCWSRSDDCRHQL